MELVNFTRDQLDALKEGDPVGYKVGNAIGLSTVARRTKTQIITKSGYRFNKHGWPLGGQYGSLYTSESMTPRVNAAREKNERKATIARITEALNNASNEQLAIIETLLKAD